MNTNKQIESILRSYSSSIKDIIIVAEDIDKATQELSELLNTPNISDLDEFIEAYIDIFPKGIRTGGKLVRSDKKGVEKKMKKFLKEYGYDQELILKVTKSYVERFKFRNYEAMRTAIYFIEKQGQGSTLAEECQSYLNKDKAEPAVKIQTLTKEDYKSLFE